MTRDMNARFLAARKQYITSQYSRMNPRQMEAVLTTQGPLLLLAGAGSGKTTVLINRIANLIRFGCASDSQEVPEYITEEDVLFLEAEVAASDPANVARADRLCELEPARPWQIIAITFTNKAANELKDRLCNMLGPEGNDVWAMTFHSACCRILRREIHHLGYDSSFTIYDTADAERVIKEILRDKNLDDKVFPPRLCLNLISKAKDKMQDPKQFLAEAGSDFRLQKIGQIYEEYKQRLVSANALDFDDIILLTVQLLQQFEEVRTAWQRRFRYVLIDEYQDTNNLQYLLASLLAGGHENICVVGDDDQSIYRFRGATIQNILDFEKQYRGARTIRLEQNYRSTQSILDAANAVISHNRGRKGKRLWTNNGAGDRLLYYMAQNENSEASFVANQILSESGGKNFKDFAILYRTNAQSNAMEVAFKRSGVPYRIIGGTRFFDRAEVKDMLAYLWVINNRSDDLRLKRIINQPPRGIGSKTVETMERLCTAANQPLYSAVCDPYSYPALERSAQKLMQFTALIEGCAELLETLSLPDFYEELLIRTGYVAMLEQKDEVENRTRLENVRELKSSIVSYVEGAENPTLGGFLEEIALYTDIDQYDSDADAVAMMTMHSAKGLEFPNVFVVGAEENLFPGTRCIGDEEEMEEERRLCYVALTRAKQRLTITGAKQRMLYGRTMVNRRSRFIDEIPPALLMEKEEQPKIYATSASGRGGGTYTGSYGESYAQRRTQRSYDTASTVAQRPKAAPLPELRKGDMVHHDTFGNGMVLSVVPAGNDAMLEIAFDQVGTKRLMLRAAAARLKKL
ncbi:MAG: UvrD-helicase domain-containing protein [Oscillospiraceae bacterium]|nr:UvrD-helicase domain-containing protein [Oscillospiraceae bacterium]